MFRILRPSYIGQTTFIFSKLFKRQTGFSPSDYRSFTKDIQFEEQDEKITVHVNYALDINGDPVADCNIDIKITALGQ